MHEGAPACMCTPNTFSITYHTHGIAVQAQYSEANASVKNACMCPSMHVCSLYIQRRILIDGKSSEINKHMPLRVIFASVSNK